MRTRDRWQKLMRAPQWAWNLLVHGRYDFTFDLMPASMRHMSMAKRLNLIFTGANLIYRRNKPWGWPIHIQIELTNYCNLRCPVCPAGTREMTRPKKAMDVGLFHRLMQEVGPNLLVSALWAWGEPLLHPQLAEILRIAREYDVATLLSTNGQNLSDDAVIDALIRYPPTYLIVAIDGISDETNSKFRVGAKLEPALRGVQRLAEIKEKEGLDLPVLHMRYIVMQHNEHELPELREFAQRNRFDLLTVRTLSIIDSAQDRHQEFVPKSEELRAYQYKDGHRVHRPDFFCVQPFWFPTVFVDGTVVACEQDYNAQMPLGVLSEDVTFADVWFGEQAAKVRKTIRDHPSSLSFCRNCPYEDRPVKDCSILAFDLGKAGDNRVPIIGRSRQPRLSMPA